MTEKIYTTPAGVIHYWVTQPAQPKGVQLIFLPGLTADHRLFEKQIAYFKNKYTTLVWDAPGHAASYPFDLSFDLFDEATWLRQILLHEGMTAPIIIGQSKGGYVGQVYAELFPEELKGLVLIDSPSLQRQYYTAIELWLLTKLTPIYKLCPWKYLLQTGAKGVAVTEYGQQLMRDMMMVYAGNQKRYAELAGHGYTILAKAVQKNLPYKLTCPHMILCGAEDRAGSCLRYIKAYQKTTTEPVHWIANAGHNSNTDQPDIVNTLLDTFVTQKLRPS